MAYNAQNTLGRTIESILNQTREDFEYYILDNGSTDDTEKIIIDYAERDKRIKQLHININDITNGTLIWSALIHATSAKYIVWCDADDEYTHDFLQNMVSFAEENQLDFAACGYEKIDGITNEVIKHRALTENLVLHGNLFTEEFIRYRGFAICVWGKLYSIPFLRRKNLIGTERSYQFCSDSIYAITAFQNADRAGIYGKAMYKYYQYPWSISNTIIKDSLTSYRDLWNATKGSIECYGPISKINEDFLYAIHLSLVEEAAGKIFMSDLPTDVKLDMFAQIFSDPVWAETLERDADPQFKNLAARGEYINEVKNKILALPGITANSPLVADIFKRLQHVPVEVIAATQKITKGFYYPCGNQ
jgi:glycosyltransferase involved in cell wall biosynthesis